jgi:hypothetical protein
VRRRLITAIATIALVLVGAVGVLSDSSAGGPPHHLASAPPPLLLAQRPVAHPRVAKTRTANRRHRLTATATAKPIGLGAIVPTSRGDKRVSAHAHRRSVPVATAADAMGSTITATAADGGTITGTDTGTGTCTPAGPSVTCDAGPTDSVAFTANAPAGYTAGMWTDSGGSPTCTGADSGTCTIVAFTAPTTDTLNASFDPVVVPHTVTAASASAGNGTAGAATTDAGVTCNGGVSCTGPNGDHVTLTATANTGYTFADWTGGSCGAASPCAVTINGDETDTAHFTANPVAITYMAGADGAVSATDNGAACGGGTCNAHYGDSITLTATPDLAYHFGGWTGGSCNGNANANCTFTATAAETDTASFTSTGSAALKPAAAVFVAPPPEGSDGNPGTAAQPVATPAKAVAIAIGSGKKQIWMTNGAYAGPLTLTAADDGLSFFGGFNATFAAESGPSTTDISGTPEGLIATGAVVSFDLVNFAGHAPGGPSSTAYGVVALSGSNVTLTGAAVTAGNGSAGTNGAAGTAGQAGGAGGAGGAGQTPAQVAAACLASNGTHCSPVDGSGGAAGRGVNGNDFFILFNPAYDKNPLLHVMALELPAPSAGPSAGDGGFGGFGDTHSTSTLQGCGGKGNSLACGPERIVAKHREVIGTYYGGWGSPTADAPNADEGGGGKPGYANVNGDGYPGATGSDGAGGGAGTNGGPGVSTSVAGPAWTPGNGAAGSSGGPGAGGGGGGGGGGNIAIGQSAVASGSGNGGGGGGGGASGGTGGTGGGGGGGSFGVYLDGGSTVTIEAGSAITAGNGGAGGNGGPGGSGGAGGAGGAGGSNGAPQEGAGGNGGHGGNGGAGGAGGGGAGGPSIAVYAADNGSTPQIAAGTPLAAGSPGAGGVSGAAGGSPVQAPGGASATCLGNNCTSIASLPLVLPALGLVHDRHVTAKLQCDAACHGTGSLRLLGTPAGPGSARFSFRIREKGIVTLHMALNKAGLAALGKHKSVLVELTITATVTGGHAETYVSTFDLARKPPKPRHK